jgi:(2Fe-2S) ferredoxin
MNIVKRPWPADFDGLATLTVCVNQRKETFVQSCGRDGAESILSAVRAGIEARDLPVEVQTIACLGLCAKGPNVRIAPSNTWFHRVTLADVPALLDDLATQLASPDTLAQDGD